MNKKLPTFVLYLNMDGIDMQKKILKIVHFLKIHP